ncbi:hypothetical protein J2S17_000247 [Cytobacillus purgationiresistens]|uniref:Uncharacterized protein n=1 Tax=Cytobacillus purgationiresistens TaxID=863449 RepID=A0ABU0AAU0_9BACI|nr:hypothetical protein [Cytobacillus purgationiresistens]
MFDYILLEVCKERLKNFGDIKAIVTYLLLDWG